MSDKWYKNNPTDVIWWKDTPDGVGEWLFSFDKKTVFNMFADYPKALTPEQKQIFDRKPRMGGLLQRSLKPHIAN